MPISVDSQEMRTFAAQLKRFADVLKESMLRTQGQMGQLSETWKDAEYILFRDSFAKTYPLLKQFIDEAEKTVPALLRDADAIEKYANLKPE